MSTRYGPAFRWFAWRPVRTQDRGWRWLRKVWRRRAVYDFDGERTVATFETSVERWSR